MSYDDFRGIMAKNIYTYNSHCHGFAIQNTMETKKIHIQLHIRIDFLYLRHKRKFIFSRY